MDNPSSTMLDITNIERGTVSIEEMKENSVILKTVNLHKTYISGPLAVQAVRGIDLEVKNGEFLAIMGPSGSGKSTFLNCLSAIDTPTMGDIFIDGQNIAALTDNQLADIRLRKIGLVFQTFQLFELLTALENVEMPMTFLKIPKKERKERALELLRMVGLEARAQHIPSELSGGEQQRIAVARALANDPPVLFLDEPTGDLDSKNSQKIMELLKSIHEKGVTLVMVTHDPEMAAYADRVINMLDGKILNEEINNKTDVNK
ncbi:ABC transporter ATP-binding protein [Candidatus Borrarchaeum sp.]|uniref:ABC transporter ATP-binding protein n=1 Tax=Candidatus Borrarchaeum sp. TaxID=2846742 RepID=UPI002580B8DB|nr:ABC transporter ATP-binding protein [Candidatus Borrarchaeum sp.]